MTENDTWLTGPARADGPPGVLCSEAIARAFHDHYERLAPSSGYRTRDESAKPWEDVPEANKRLMIGVVYTLLAEGVITAGSEVFYA